MITSSPLQELEALIRAGAARRWPSPLSEAVRTRLDEELAWLRAKPEAWHPAFLLACNRFASARELKAAIAPCRGAATGSAIAYALGLTDLAPLAHGLRPEPFFFRAAPTFPLETDTKVAIDVRQWARIHYATNLDTAQLLGIDDENAPEHSAVQDALDELRRRLDVFRKVGHPIDLAAIPLDAPLTFKAFATGNTDGIPAFQSLPMLAALRGIRPRTLNDLALLYTLTLPGPCLFYNDFLRRNTFAKTPSARAESAPHPSADAQRDNLPAADEPSHMGMDAGSRPAWLAALAETHGILLWQEQALTLLRDLAGFSAEDAWQILRALLKDKYTTLRRARPRFIKGALANPTFAPALPALRALLPGFTDELTSLDSIPTAPKALAQRLWDDLLFFASTLYPKSHALARSLLAYRLLYLRLHNTHKPTP